MTEVTEHANTGSRGDTMLVRVPEGPAKVFPGNSDAAGQLRAEQQRIKGRFLGVGVIQDCLEEVSSLTTPFSLSRCTPESRMFVNLGRWIWKLRPNHKIYKPCVCSWASWHLVAQLK